MALLSSERRSKTLGLVGMVLARAKLQEVIQRYHHWNTGTYNRKVYACHVKAGELTYWIRELGGE